MSWDGEEVLREPDAETGAWFTIAIHSTRLGPAVGGTRMKPYPSPAEAEADARRLSAAMTLKMVGRDDAQDGGVRHAVGRRKGRHRGPARAHG